MHRGGPKGASTPTILEELQQDMVANPLLIDTVEYLRAAFPAPIASNDPSPEALAAIPTMTRARRASSIGSAEGVYGPFGASGLIELPGIPALSMRDRSNSSLMSNTDLRRTMSWDMNEDLAMSHQQIHLSPELTQMSFEMSRNYFLDYILRDQTGRKVFMQFLQTQHCAENLMFWYDVEKYAGLKDDQQELRVKKAQYIMAKYVSTDSETEVNLPYSIKQELQKNLARPTKDLFAAAQRSIFLLMVYGTLDYFLKSERYRLYKATREQNPGSFDEDSITDEQLERALKEAKLRKETLNGESPSADPRLASSAGAGESKGRLGRRSLSLRSMKKTPAHDKKNCLVS